MQPVASQSEVSRDAGDASAAGPVAVSASATPEKRDWVAWYEDLSEGERRELRGRIVLANPDEVKADAEMRHFFLFHVEDLVHESPPGTRRLQEFFHVVMTIRGREELAEDRRKAVAYLLAEYQHYLRDNPFTA